MFAGDQIDGREPAFWFAYASAGRFGVSDVAVFPNGDLIVLDRVFSLSFRFSNSNSLIAASEPRPKHVDRARLPAVLDSPVIPDTFEGIAATQEQETQEQETREDARMVLWLVSDNNQSMQQRSLQLMFALDQQALDRRALHDAKSPPAR